MNVAHVTCAVRRLAVVLGMICVAGPVRGQAIPGPADRPGAGSRPNIVLIMADDMGFSDIGPYGGEIGTPSLDRLAREGLRFTQFYNAARCSPSRAALLTGLYPHQAGMGDMPDAYATRVRQIFDSPAYSDHLSSDAPTIAEALHAAGYATYMAGKWHLGYDRPQWPADRGFDRSFTVIEGAMNYYGHGIQHTGKIGDPPMAEDGEVYHPPREGFFATDAWTDHAVRYIREHDGARPFFLYLAYTAPHWPLQAPSEDIARHRGEYLRKGWDRLRRERHARLVETGVIDSAWELAPRPEGVPAWDSLPEAERERWDLEMSIYAAQVERMDAGIGRVLETLRQQEMEENTLVIFLSDNGGAAEDPNRSLEGATPGGRDFFEGYGIRGAHVSSAPFRLTKKWVHEGGIATPFIVRWPGGIDRVGGLYRQPAHLVDLMPTLLEVAGAGLPPEEDGRPAAAPEGVSLLPAFRDRPLPDRAIFWEHEGNRAVREGRWKLVSQFPGDWELYDMEADRTELHDLSREQPERAARMADLWEGWARRAGVRPWSLVAPRAAIPHLPAYPSSVGDAVDGEVAFTPDAPWTPLLDVDWDGSSATTEAWLRANWSERGVHLSFVLPRADEAERMPTGRTPDAPFVVQLTFGGGEGEYDLRCIPLVEPVSRMTYRHPAYLFNHRLGANARVGESGHVLCHEVSLLGVLADSLETRWSASPAGGLVFEALVPWRTLRLDGPPDNGQLPFRVRVARPEAAVAWGSDERPGRLRLVRAGERPPPGDRPIQPRLRAVAVRQPRLVEAAMPATGAGAVTFTLEDRDGRAASRADGTAAGDGVLAALSTRGLADGQYLLRVRRGEELLGERDVYLVDDAAAEEVEAPAAALARRLDVLEARAAGPGEAWRAGHLARARAALRAAALPDRLELSSLERAVQRLADARAIADALEAGRRPSREEEGYGHPVGFAADGRHGPVEFVPTDATTARLTVHASREAGWSLTPRLYGTFSEPVVYDRPVYGWLYAQALRNPSLEFGHPSAEETVEDFIRYRELEPAAARAALAGEWIPRLPESLEQVAAPWIAVGRGSARFTTECPGAFNDRQCQRIEADGGAREVGIAQVLSLPAWRETRYLLRGFARSAGGVGSARAVLYHEGRPVSTARLPDVGAEWTIFTAELEAPRLEGPLTTFMLALVFDGPGRLDLDLVTLFPADSVDGFDPAAVAQLRELHTGWIRWPGGNLASGYHWRDGVGPREERPSLPNPSWPGLSSNFVGTDEYLRLTERIGTEPLITVNAGDGSAAEAAAWVEYVNGDTTTAMGRLRAWNGHPEPYGVRYWNIGNELWGHWQVGYTNPEEHARRYSAFARAMRAVDPDIRLVANGHGGHSESPPDPWNDPLLAEAGGELDIIDVHTYVGVPEGPELPPSERAFLLSAIPLSYERWLTEFREDLERRGLGEVEVIVGEYNASIHSDSAAVDRLASLLVYAGYLHAFMRQGEYVVGANATEYTPFDPRALAFGRMHPRYDLFRTYARLAGTRPLEAVLETPVVQQDRRVGRDVVPIFNLPLVDAVALEDPGDGSLGVSLINRDMERAHPVEVRLEEFAAAGNGRWILFGAALDGRMVERPLPPGESFTLTLPPHSVSLLKVYRRR